jgi:hypothetical protein
MDLMRRMIKEEEKCSAEFQNGTHMMKLMMEIWRGRHAKFQNSIDAVKRMIIMERKHCAKFWDEMNSIKMILNRLLLMHMKETLYHPASKQSPVKMMTPTETYLLASTSAVK